MCGPSEDRAPRSAESSSLRDHSTAPLPDCLDSILQNQILKGAKRSKMSKMKSELNSAKPESIFGDYRGTLKKEFEAAVKKREKMPAVSLFAKFMMSRPTLGDIITACHSKGR